MAKIDSRIADIALSFIKAGKNKRAAAVLKQLLAQGSISTDELNDLGYNHPPRAAADVKDAGIPIRRTWAVSKRTGRRMAVYSFGDPTDIREGRIGGRSAFPKKFKAALLERYGSIDCITGATLDSKVLQIDHRIPYRVGGDDALGERKVEQYMLLDGSSQRAKSWACEHCQNLLKLKEPITCLTCFWASPERYEHIAMESYRRVDVTWQDDDVAVFDSMKYEAERAGLSVAEFIRRLVRQRGNGT